MNAVSKLFLNRFLIFGITFGILLFLRDLALDTIFSLTSYILLSVVFGVLNSLVAVAYRLFKLKKLDIGEFKEEN